MKQPTTKFIWLGYLTAVVFEIATIYQYWIKFPDTDRFIAYSLLALSVFAISWIYNWVKRLGYQLDYIEEKLQDKLE